MGANDKNTNSKTANSCNWHISFLLLAGILGSYFVLHRSIPHRVVVISQDGKEVQRIAMDTVKIPISLKLRAKMVHGIEFGFRKTV